MKYLVLVLLLAGCSGLNPLSLLTGGGPNVAANVQAGKENNQSIVAPTTRTEVRTGSNSSVETSTAKVKADEVRTIVVNEIPGWVILLLVLGWVLPTPNQIGQSFINLFKRKKP